MPTTDDVKVGFIGFGNMASAMADGWIASGVVPGDRLCVREPLRGPLRAHGVARDACVCVGEELVRAVDVVVVAIKPYLIEDVLPELAGALANKTIISVAAGWDSKGYEHILPGTHHISTVPNTPVAICEGVIACERKTTLSVEEALLVHELLGALGTVVEVDSHLLSIAGTIGGCSPAFIAMVIEALGDAAVKYGIPRATAYEMVSQMVAGTAKLQLATGQHPGAMKDAVCSPGGTTIKGVAALEAAGMRSAFIKAIDAIEG